MERGLTGLEGLAASQICTRVVSSMSAASNGGNGYIVLFHVGAQSLDAKALSCITNTFRAAGSRSAQFPK